MATSDATGGDANLVTRAVGGDQQAFADIYDRYADSIYSFCRSRLRNEADAADATQDTFVRAVTRLSQLRDPDKLRAWLYAIARNEIVSTARISGHYLGDEAMVHVVSSDPEPDVDLLRVESAAQLWAAAGGLKDRDHEVLELHLRHGLVGQDLADALGVSEPHANVMLSRMRDRIATSLGSLLVARQGREECDELDAVLDGWDGHFTLAIRSRVTRHTKSCAICERTRGAALASSLSFGVLPMVAAPRFLRDLTVDSMASAFATATTTAPSGSGVARDGAESMKWRPPEEWSWREDGFPGEAVAGATRRGFWLLSAAAVAVMVAFGATLYALSGAGSGDAVDASGVLSEVSSELAATTQSATPPGSPALGAEATDSPTSMPDTGDSVDPEALAASTTQATALAAAPPTTGGQSIAGDSSGAGAPPPTQTAATSTSEAPTTAATTTAVPATSTSEAPTTAATATTGATTTPTDATSTTGAAATTTTGTTATTRTTAATTTSGAPPASTTTTTGAPNAQPIIDRLLIRPNPVQAAQGRCAGQEASVFVEASDSDGRVVAVVIRWSPDGVEFRAESLELVAGTFRALIGPWTVEGAQEVAVVVADDGGAATSDSAKLTVTPCPVGRLTLTP